MFLAIPPKISEIFQHVNNIVSMSLIKPKPGELFLCAKEGIYISGRDLTDDLDIFIGDPIMFLSHETYEEALAYEGYSWTDTVVYEREFDKDVAFWRCLWREHIIHLPAVDVKVYLRRRPNKPRHNILGV